MTTETRGAMAPVKAKPGPDVQGAMDSLTKARVAALAALDKKALDLVVLNMMDLVDYTDCFIICTGTSSPHVEAIVESMEAALSALGVEPSGIEGKRAAHWVLLDYGDVVVHVFDRPAREFYELEKLWLDAPRVEVDEDKAVMGREDQGALDR